MNICEFDHPDQFLHERFLINFELAGERHKTGNDSFIINYVSISDCVCAFQVVIHNI